MPELPEVETVRKVLITWVEHKKINDIKFRYHQTLENCSEEEFINCLKGKTIDSINRYGKYLMFNIGEYCLFSHLRMEGKYFLGHYPNTISKGLEFSQDNHFLYAHTEIIFEMENDELLLYHDTRKFGKFFLCKKEDLYVNSPLTHLGKEPFDMEDGKLLLEAAKCITCSIKELIMNQDVIAGIGNIYADEILFISKIAPFKKCKEISKEEADEIVRNAKKVLTKAIELGGSSVHSFSFGNDASGRFQNELKAYGKEGEPCSYCGAPMTFMKIGGRGTCFCGNCQNNIQSKKANIIGVTGLIGSGKSTIAQDFTNYGYKLLDADKIAKECYDKDNPKYEEIIKLFGEDIANDKDKIREIIISNPEKKKSLEEIIHPYVVERIKNSIKKNQKYVLDVPLLFESKLNKLCDQVVFVNVSESIRIKRLVSRNTMPIKEARKLNSSVMDAYKKIKQSNYVVDNSSTFENSKFQIKKFFDIIK